jgi:23S rRNA pseudouridine1911/1915/1917 synthase
MSEIIKHVTAIPEALAGWRFDQVLAELFPAYSRSRLQKWIREGQATINDVTAPAKTRVLGGERVTLTAIEEVETDWAAESIPLDIVYEDEAIIVINKPAGLVVHPAAGNWAGTLGNALLHHAPELMQVPRAGVIHRLDKETSGLLVVARTLEAQHHLVDQLQARAFEREYQAVVAGVMTGGGRIDAPIGRHPTNRLKMTVREDGRESVTHYRVLTRFRAHTHISVQLETGRTHQIRVHMAHIHYSLVGDPVYGGRPRLPAGASPSLIETLRGFRRQALHASRLGIEHPLTGESLHWEASLPADFVRLLQALRQDQQETHV